MRCQIVRYGHARRDRSTRFARSALAAAKRSIPDMGDPVHQEALQPPTCRYLPEDQFSYPLKMNVDTSAAAFTEIPAARRSSGQVSVNISKPGIVKGNHWHNTKNEKFLVVSGKGVIRFRRIGSAAVTEYHVTGERLEMVDVPVGYTHHIENVGETDMVTFMWCSECFDKEKPDTIFEEV